MNIQRVIRPKNATGRPSAALRFLCAVLAALFAATGDAQVQPITNAPPDRLSYQGYLVDANGAPLAPSTPANFTVVFRIWTAATSGARLWTEQQVVTVDRGNFSVVLGEGTVFGTETRPPLSTVLTAGANASERFIGISVTISGVSTDILPRLRLLSSPYAFLATSARNITSPLGTILLTHTNNRVEVTGNLFASGTISGAFSGNGSSLSNIAAAALPTHFTGQRTFDGPVGIITQTPGDALQVGGFTGTSNTFITAATGGSAVRAGVKLRHSSSLFGWTLDSDNTDGSFRLLGHQNDVNGVARLLVNRSSGNIGINGGLTGFPLTFGSAVGDKISLYGNAGNHYGFGVQSGQLQIHSDASTSDIVFGYGASASMTERMRIKGTGNVGIGAASPARLLQVGSGTTANSEGMIRLESRSGTGLASRRWEIGVPETDEVVSGTGYSFVIDDADAAGTEFVLKYGSGFMGLGTNSPGARLHVADAGAVVARIDSSSRIGTWLALGNNSPGGRFWQLIATGTDNGGGAGNLQLGQGTAPGVSDGVMTLTPNGLVGIGTLTPRAPLEVGRVSELSGSFFRYTYNGNGAVNGFTTSPAMFSIFSAGSIVASGGLYLTGSDARIKDVIGVSDGRRDLETFMGLKVTDYTMVDKVANGDRRQKRLVAQDVEKTFPQAVIRSTDVIPDIMTKGEAKGGWVSFAPAKPLNPALKSGDKVRLMTEKSVALHEITEVTAAGFRVKESVDGTVFVYGREVNDFRTVDYDAIAMLNVSVTQELARRLEKVEQRESRLAGLEEKAARVAALEQELAELKKLVAQLASAGPAGTKQAAQAAATPATPVPSASEEAAAGRLGQ